MDGSWRSSIIVDSLSAPSVILPLVVLHGRSGIVCCWDKLQPLRRLHNLLGKYATGLFHSMLLNLCYDCSCNFAKCPNDRYVRDRSEEHLAANGRHLAHHITGERWRHDQSSVA